jgi:predicted AAA+ superfamily ATPase
MKQYPRFYSELLNSHLKDHRQMAFISGPRQVGKTSICSQLATTYINWDNQDSRQLILKGPAAIASFSGLDQLTAQSPIIAFDEIHRYAKWKTFLKGFFDVHGKHAKIIVTGSSRLDVFKRGGDSLMGRYFLYRMHPLSVAELASPSLKADVISRPHPIDETEWSALWTYGGFPEPFAKRDMRFWRRWQTLRQSQLLREDVRDLTRVHDLDQLIALNDLLQTRSSGQVIYSSLATAIRVSENTVRAWVSILTSLHVGFLVKPWHRSLTAAIRKEPKWFLRDWSGIDDVGQRSETFVACHLLKAVEGWTDMGLGQFDLYYLRDKQKREVDFLVTRNREPWMLVEVKASDTTLSPSLKYMQDALKAKYAFQVVLELPYVNKSCFDIHTPVVVPARTFLSQLI